jgi:hypothetical protein
VIPFRLGGRVVVTMALGGTWKNVRGGVEKGSGGELDANCGSGGRTIATLGGSVNERGNSKGF